MNGGVVAAVCEGGGKDNDGMGGSCVSDGMVEVVVVGVEVAEVTVMIRWC